MKRRDALRLCLATSLLVGPSRVFLASANETGKTSIQRHLRWNVVLANPFAEELRDQVLWMYLPAYETPTQNLTGLQVSAAHKVHRDRFGHGVLEINVERLSPFGQRVISVSVVVSLFNSPRSTSLHDESMWLADERYIEVNDPRIRSLASELKRQTAVQTARAIYEWVMTNMEYAGYISHDLGAREALVSRRGDCTEYAFLAAALVRANGIPARMVGGYVVGGDALLRADDYHNWAEFYADGCWHLLDAQKRHWLDPANQYVAFRYYSAEPTNAIGAAHRFAIRGEMHVRL